MKPNNWNADKKIAFDNCKRPLIRGSIVSL